MNFIQVAEIISEHFQPDGIVVKALEWALKKEGHIMEITRMRALGSLFSMLNECVRRIITYNNNHSDFPLTVSWFTVPCVVLFYIQKFGVWFIFYIKISRMWFISVLKKSD